MGIQYGCSLNEEGRTGLGERYFNLKTQGWADIRVGLTKIYIYQGTILANTTLKKKKKRKKAVSWYRSGRDQQQGIAELKIKRKAVWTTHSQLFDQPRLQPCLHGGGGPQIGEVTCGGSPHLSYKRDQIKTQERLYGQAGYHT